MSFVAAIPVVGKITDKIFPEADQADKAQAQPTQMAINGELDELAQQARVIIAEAQREGWLQHSWRPIVILVFTGLMVCRWMGWASPDLTRRTGVKTDWYRAARGWRVHCQ